MDTPTVKIKLPPWRDWRWVAAVAGLLFAFILLMSLWFVFIGFRRIEDTSTKRSVRANCVNAITAEKDINENALFLAVINRDAASVPMLAKNLTTSLDHLKHLDVLCPVPSS